MKDFNNLKYMIVLVSEVNQVDFSQVLEFSTDTLRLSADSLKTFFKWEGETPSSVDELNYKDGPHTHAEIMDILTTPEWVIEPDVI